jgi:hypothetical protein
MLAYPARVGRSFDEILHVLDALEPSARYRAVTPVNWRSGEDTVVPPFISGVETERMFADQGGLCKARSYRRYVRDSSLRCL